MLFGKGHTGGGGRPPLPRLLKCFFVAGGLLTFLAILLLLPPVQGLLISSGSRLKGRPLDAEHWRRVLRELACCLVAFPALLGAFLCWVNACGGLRQAAATVNARKARGLYLGLLFFMLALLAAGAYVTDGHDWGGDFAEYIMQGISIAEGTYETSYLAQPLFFVYPHGFPLLLAPVYRLFGFNLLAFKMVNVVLYAAFVFALFMFCDRELERATSCTIAFLFALSPCLFKLVDCVLSDISNMLFSFLGVCAISFFCREARPGRKLLLAALAGFFSSCAYICRDSGLVLPCTLAASQILFAARRLAGKGKGRGRPDLLLVLSHAVPYLIFFACSFLVNDILFPSSGRKQLDLFRYLSVGSVLSNCSYYFHLFSSFFYPRFVWYAAFTAIIWGMAKSFRRDYVLAFYLWGTLALYIIWPIGGQGIRYVVSVLPVLLFFGGRAVELLPAAGGGQLPPFVFSRRSYLLLAGLLCVSSLSVSVVAGVRNLASSRYLSSGSYTKDAVEMYRYIDGELPDGCRIFFFKPRVLLMATGNDCVYSDPSRLVDAGSFDFYLHTFDHGYGQLLSDEQAAADSFFLGDERFVCVHENGRMKLFRRDPR